MRVCVCVTVIVVIFIFILIEIFLELTCSVNIGFHTGVVYSVHQFTDEQ